MYGAHQMYYSFIYCFKVFISNCMSLVQKWDIVSFQDLILYLVYNNPLISRYGTLEMSAVWKCSYYIEFVRIERVLKMIGTNVDFECSTSGGGGATGVIESHF